MKESTLTTLPPELISYCSAFYVDTSTLSRQVIVGYDLFSRNTTNPFSRYDLTQLSDYDKAILIDNFREEVNLLDNEHKIACCAMLARMICNNQFETSSAYLAISITKVTPFLLTTLSQNTKQHPIHKELVLYFRVLLKAHDNALLWEYSHPSPLTSIIDQFRPCPPNSDEELSTYIADEYTFSDRETVLRIRMGKRFVHKLLQQHPGYQHDIACT